MTGITWHYVLKFIITGVSHGTCIPAKGSFLNNRIHKAMLELASHLYLSV
jgi:hypothetical protein